MTIYDSRKNDNSFYDYGSSTENHETYYSKEYDALDNSYPYYDKKFTNDDDFYYDTTVENEYEYANRTYPFNPFEGTYKNIPLKDLVYTSTKFQNEILNEIFTRSWDIFTGQTTSYRDVHFSVWVWLINSPSENIRFAIAEHKNMLPKILNMLRLDDDVEVRTELASNPSIPNYTLEYLAEDENANVRAVVAESQTLNPKFLIQLGEDFSMEVRMSVAQNRKTPVEVLEKLSVDWEADVVRCVAGNLSTPVSLLVEISENKKMFSVQRALLSNPNTPDDVVIALAGQGFSMLELCSYRNNLPVQVCEMLVKEQRFTFVRRQRFLQKLVQYPEYKDWPQEWLEATFDMVLS